MTTTINIQKSAVYELIEGITANIGRKNPDADFEALWASQGDSESLDLFFGEAKNDLENTLQHWIGATSLSGGTYTMQLNVMKEWPTAKLNPILQSTVERYFAHAILGGWLGIMPSIQIGIDYGAAATDDLGEIVGIVLKRKTVAAVAARHSDSSEEGEDPFVAEAGARHTDSSGQGEEPFMAEAGARHTDAEAYDEDSETRAGARHTNRDHIPVRTEHETLDLSGEQRIYINNINSVRHGKEEHNHHHKPW